MSAINEVPLSLEEHDLLHKALAALFMTDKPLPASGKAIRDLMDKLEDFASLQVR